MIKLLFTVLFVCASTIATFSQDAASQQKTKDNQQIAVSELPEIIRSSLTREDYIGWAVGNAFKKEKGGKTIYIVELTKGAETKTVKFDAGGKKLNEKEKNN